MLPFNYYLFRDRRRLDKKVSNACLIMYPQRTQGEEAGCQNITEKSIVEQSGLRFEMASKKHFHIT